MYLHSIFHQQYGSKPTIIASTSGCVHLYAYVDVGVDPIAVYVRLMRG